MEKERKQNKSAVWIMAAVILIASCAIGFSVYKGLKAVSMGERVVTVKGAAELEVKADVGSKSIRFSYQFFVLSLVLLFQLLQPHRPKRLNGKHSLNKEDKYLLHHP